MSREKIIEELSDIIETEAKDLWEIERDVDLDGEWESAEQYRKALYRATVRERYRKMICVLEAAGYVVAPREPTEAMYDAACKDMGYSVASSVSYKWKDAVSSQWKAMLTASQKEE